MATVIYQTNTGSSKQYAELLAEKLSLTVYPLSKSDAVDKNEDIIFIGWVMAGDIQGLAQAREKFTNIICVCPVGLSATEKTKEEIIAKNSVTEPVFLLPGNFHIDRLTGMYKLMMSMMIKMLKGKLKEKPGADTDKIMTAFETGVDQVSEDKLSEVIAFLTQE
ncbi:MAG: hypothetical protein IJN88_00110 [Clostridia bacterium]|nr:hypothetical protein [Clostridia bacterium]